MVCKGNCCPGKFRRGVRAIFPEPWQCLNSCCHRKFPPSNCYKNIVLTYECGSACDETNFASLEEVEVVGYYSPNPLSAQELPIFSYNKIYNKNFRFDITAGSPSVPVSAIPCIEYIVIITAIGPCCIEIADGKFYAAGSGKVKARSSVLSIVAGNSGPPVTINGKRSPYNAKDAQILDIKLIAKNCELKNIDVIGQDQGPCPSLGVAKKKTLLNDLNLKHRDKIKQRQSGLKKL